MALHVTYLAVYCILVTPLGSQQLFHLHTILRTAGASCHTAVVAWPGSSKLSRFRGHCQPLSPPTFTTTHTVTHSLTHTFFPVSAPWHHHHNLTPQEAFAAEAWHAALSRAA
jgi:hypothetical protein